MLTKYTQKQINEIVDWMYQTEWNSMVTLTLCAEGREVQNDEACRLLGKLVSRIMKRLYPRKSKKKLVMAPFLERNTLGVLHFHILFKLDGDAAANKRLLKEIWTKLDAVCGDPDVHDKTGEKWYIEISAQPDRRRITEYVMKTCVHDIEALVLKYAYLGPVSD
jgi:hypothetical protein